MASSRCAGWNSAAVLGRTYARRARPSLSTVAGRHAAFMQTSPRLEGCRRSPFTLTTRPPRTPTLRPQPTPQYGQPVRVHRSERSCTASTLRSARCKRRTAAGHRRTTGIVHEMIQRFLSRRAMLVRWAVLNRGSHCEVRPAGIPFKLQCSGSSSSDSGSESPGTEMRGAKALKPAPPKRHALSPVRRSSDRLRETLVSTIPRSGSTPNGLQPRSPRAGRVAKRLDGTLLRRSLEIASSPRTAGPLAVSSARFARDRRHLTLGNDAPSSVGW